LNERVCLYAGDLFITRCQAGRAHSYMLTTQNRNRINSRNIVIDTAPKKSVRLMTAIVWAKNETFFKEGYMAAPQIQLWCWHCAPYKCSYYYYYYYYYYMSESRRQYRLFSGQKHRWHDRSLRNFNGQISSNFTSDMIEVYEILTGKYHPTLPVFYTATLTVTPEATHWNCAHIIPSTIYANTTLRLGSLVSGTASQHMWSQQFQ